MRSTRVHLAAMGVMLAAVLICYAWKHFSGG